MGDVVVTATAGHGHGGTTAPGIIAMTHLWLVWAEIAIDHERAARAAREQAVALRPQGSPEFSEALSRELRASMVAVSAAAHALDAFYGAVKRYVQLPATTVEAWERNRTARRSRILETLKLGFAVGRAAQRWHAEFRWLFGLRDGVVHAEERWQSLRPHPVGGKMTPEHVMYAHEASVRAVDLVLDVLDGSFTGPKPNDGQLSEYLAMRRDVPARVRQRRDGPLA